jgi:hypothetical protein
MIPSRYPPGIKGKQAKTMWAMHFGEQNAPFCECFVFQNAAWFFILCNGTCKYTRNLFLPGALHI